jgi:lysophospholipase L1-like esterase
MFASRRFLPLVLGFGLLSFVALIARAADDKPQHSAVKPNQRMDKGAVKLHESFLERAKKGDVDVLFLGDSITQGWGGGSAKEVWEGAFGKLKPANFGIGGDRTEHVLWRITEGKELEGIQPKVVVLMIGTNNMGSNSAEQIADGVTAIVKELNHQRPHTKTLLLGIFPRSAKATDAVREKIKDCNGRIAKLDDGKMVHYLDIGGKFLESDGSLSKEIMPDALHLSKKGYQIWADAIKEDLGKLLANKE